MPLDLINQYDIMGVIGNGAILILLWRQELKMCRHLIAWLQVLDELNLLTCLIAKKTGNCQTIARVRNPGVQQRS